MRIMTQINQSKQSEANKRHYEVSATLGDQQFSPGHWIAEERPDFLVKELTKFFGE